MSNKRMLCVSWCDADEVINYGQILQGCAMMYNLRRQSNEIIKYVSYCPRGIKSRIKYFLKHYNPISGHLTAYLKSRKTINSFTTENNIAFYQVSSETELESISHGINYLICGSDQIWHPLNYDKNYFLNFGDKSAKRISYAASLPKTKFEPQFETEYQAISKRLKEIDSISVREKGSCIFIEDMCGKEVAHVLDPTYLVPKNIWEDCIEHIDIPAKYIFVYIPNGTDKRMVSAVNELKAQLNIENVLVMMTRGENYFSNSQNLRFVSVGQFLFLIKNAACVITSSFHAVVFSTIFHTEFWCYDVPNEFRGEDIRLDDLLEILGLEERKIDNKNLNVIKSTINYIDVDLRLHNEKEKSFRYLEKCLGEVISRGDDS